MNESGLIDDFLFNHSIGYNSYTFDSLISAKCITFFTNWKDSINFPSIYGSGVIIPGYDHGQKSILYICVHGTYSGIYKTDVGMTWNKLN